MIAGRRGRRGRRGRSEAPLLARLVPDLPVLLFLGLGAALLVAGPLATREQSMVRSDAVDGSDRATVGNADVVAGDPETTPGNRAAQDPLGPTVPAHQTLVIDGTGRADVTVLLVDGTTQELAVDLPIVLDALPSSGVAAAEVSVVGRGVSGCRASAGVTGLEPVVVDEAVALDGVVVCRFG